MPVSTRAGITLALTLAIAVASTAQGPDMVGWSQLLQSSNGRRATVRLRDGGSVRGRIAASTGQALMVGSRSIGCAEIASVENKKKSRRALWAALGGAAGLAAGAVLATRFSNEGNDGAAVGLAAGLAAAGAGIGFAAGGKGKSETYTLAPDACGR